MLAIDLKWIFLFSILVLGLPLDHSYSQQRDSMGWTVISQSIDSRLIYVSSSEGLDSNDGLSSKKPKKTLAAAKGLLRHGYPDHLLLKRGDSWTESFGHWILSGRSSLEPMVIASYGDSLERPKLRPILEDGLYRSGGGGSPAVIENLWFIGLDLEPQNYKGVGQISGMSFLGTTKNILIEDCLIRGFKDNIALQSDPLNLIENIVIRRSSILDAFSNDAVNGHSQGIFASNVKGLMVEENFIDHNGWNGLYPGTYAGTYPTVFNHNMYITAENFDVTVRNNIISRASAHGLQLRCGGEIYGNIFLRNPLAAFVAYSEGVISDVHHNIVLEGVDLDVGAPRAMGIQSIGSYKAKIHDNLVLNSLSQSPYAWAFSVASAWDAVNDTSQVDVELTNNIVYNWTGLPFSLGPIFHPNNHIELHGNQAISSTGIIAVDFLDNIGRRAPALYSISDSNQFYSSAAPGLWFSYDNSILSSSDWRNKFQDSTTSFDAFSFLDPARDTIRYQTYLGAEPTFDAFIQAVRRQSKARWNPNYESAAISSYIWIGFTADSFCQADFNRDGFVNGTDYDRFTEAFFIGSQSADIDGNGFVNGDDFDTYALAFESGCNIIHP